MWMCLRSFKTGEKSLINLTNVSQLTFKNANIYVRYNNEVVTFKFDTFKESERCFEVLCDKLKEKIVFDEKDTELS